MSNKGLLGLILICPKKLDLMPILPVLISLLALGYSLGLACGNSILYFKTLCFFFVFLFVILFKDLYVGLLLWLLHLGVYLM